MIKSNNGGDYKRRASGNTKRVTPCCAFRRHSYKTEISLPLCVSYISLTHHLPSINRRAAGRYQREILDRFIISTFLSHRVEESQYPRCSHIDNISPRSDEQEASLGTNNGSGYNEVQFVNKIRGQDLLIKLLSGPLQARVTSGKEGGEKPFLHPLASTLHSGWPQKLKS